MLKQVYTYSVIDNFKLAVSPLQNIESEISYYSNYYYILFIDLVKPKYINVNKDHIFTSYLLFMTFLLIQFNDNNKRDLKNKLYIDAETGNLWTVWILCSIWGFTNLNQILVQSSFSQPLLLASLHPTESQEHSNYLAFKKYVLHIIYWFCAKVKQFKDFLYTVTGAVRYICPAKDKEGLSLSVECFYIWHTFISRIFLKIGRVTI